MENIMFNLEKETGALDYIFKNSAGVISYEIEEKDIFQGDKEKKLKSIIYKVGLVGGFLDSEILKEGGWQILKASYEPFKEGYEGYWSYFIRKVIHEVNMSVFPLLFDYSYEELEEIREFETEVLKKIKNSIIDEKIKKGVWKQYPTQKAFFNANSNNS